MHMAMACTGLILHELRLKVGDGKKNIRFKEICYELYLQKGGLSRIEYDTIIITILRVRVMNAEEKEMALPPTAQEVQALRGYDIARRVFMIVLKKKESLSNFTRFLPSP